MSPNAHLSRGFRALFPHPGDGLALFTLAAEQTVELQHYLSGTDTNTLGYPASTGENEVYAEIKLWKIV